MTLSKKLLIVLALASPAGAAEEKPSPQALEFFEQRVRPVLSEHCFSCHGPRKQQGGLRLDSRAAVLKGSDTGPVVVPGWWEKSPLSNVLSHMGDIKMPPKAKLPAPAIEALREWVRQGVPWPTTPVAGTTTTLPSMADARTTHWAFRPVTRPPVPTPAHPERASNPVDRFLLEKLEQQGLSLAPETDRRTLLRRLTWDLIGLPPTPAEIEAFVSDPAPDAWEKVVDRLLASPQYGERWGRHWLDVARYADTKGYVFTEERRYPFSYTYRDYVIRAFNDDLPYDRFLMEQIAGDRLPTEGDNRHLAALGFLTLGRRFLNNTNDIIDDRLDVVLRGLQGLTIGCARCHDHKFDPITMKDYYALHGIFASSVEPRDLPTLATPSENATYQAYRKELEQLEKAARDFEKANEGELKARNRKFRDELKGLQRKVEAHKATHPGAPPQAMVLVDAPQPVQPVVFLRGNPGNRGPAVPRRYLEVLSPPQAPPFRDGSGRLELAQAIATRDNPLTARVLVNRLWMHHFGQGIVRTPGDFGLRGEPPTHPGLLDWLAAELQAEGWSIKRLHRRILLSAAYRQSSQVDAKARAIDPENRLLAGWNRRRLEYEALRDGLLALAGRLDTTAGGRSVDLEKAPFATRRTVYGFIDRQNLPGVLRTFDVASPDSSTPQRHRTTVPPQALFLMNSPFVLEQARRLAARADLPPESEPTARLTALYRLVLGRRPDSEELTLGLSFLKEASPDKGWTSWEALCQVLMLSNEFAFVD